MKIIRILMFFFAAAVFFQDLSYSQDAEIIFESPETKATLVELFTAQGCSSCLPAETWFYKLKNDPNLWKP